MKESKGVIREMMDKERKTDLINSQKSAKGHGRVIVVVRGTEV